MERNKTMTMTGFIKKYYKGGFPHQRLGQAFCNVYNLTNPTLFYMEDESDALNYISANLLKVVYPECYK